LGGVVTVTIYEKKCIFLKYQYLLFYIKLRFTNYNNFFYNGLRNWYWRTPQYLPVHPITCPCWSRDQSLFTNFNILILHRGEKRKLFFLNWSNIFVVFVLKYVFTKFHNNFGYFPALQTIAIKLQWIKNS
jgi:hypothetical protein